MLLVAALKADCFLTVPEYFSSYSGSFDKPSRFIAELPADKLTVETSKRLLETLAIEGPIWR